MNSPEDDLRDIDIHVYAESDDFRMKEPHFHFCKGRIGNDHKYLVDVEVKIRDIENMSILRSNTGNLSWSGLKESRQIVIKWLHRKAYDADISNKEAIRQEWNRCNMNNRVEKKEL